MGLAPAARPPPRPAETHAFHGAARTDPEQAEALAGQGLQVRTVADPAEEAASLLAEGRIVGWFQGRAEVGPRALGARSILADPRRAETKDIVNARVKRRESFRPFAPACCTSTAPTSSRATPPTRSCCWCSRCGPTAEPISPADQSLRRPHPGVPVVLNTSFNLRGEPIVHRPAEAVADFLASDMDALLLGNMLATKT